MVAAATDVLDEMTRRIVERFAPEEIVLFGSRARGDAQPDSDYDILVIVERCANRREAAVAVRSALADMPASKDIIVATREEAAHVERSANKIIEVALQEGHRLYARG